MDEQLHILEHHNWHDLDIISGIEEIELGVVSALPFSALVAHLELAHNVIQAEKIGSLAAYAVALTYCRREKVAKSYLLATESDSSDVTKVTIRRSGTTAANFLARNDETVSTSFALLEKLKLDSVAELVTNLSKKRKASGTLPRIIGVSHD